MYTYESLTMVFSGKGSVLAPEWDRNYPSTCFWHLWHLSVRGL